MKTPTLKYSVKSTIAAGFENLHSGRTELTHSFSNKREAAQFARKSAKAPNIQKAELITDV